MNGFCDIIKEVHYSSGLPVLADADTGFGEGEMCAKTVWEYFNAGASGNFFYSIFSVNPNILKKHYISKIKFFQRDVDI